MKLRNKKTGEIRDFIINKDKIQTASAIDCWEYNSLAELNEEWEDYEEPEYYWYYDTQFGRIEKNSNPLKSDMEQDKQIGNYFETREEAEKAVEKLKALKRLKDKGFKFIGVRTLGKVIDYDIPAPYNRVGFHDINDKDTKEFYDDLRLLFGH